MATARKTSSSSTSTTKKAPAKKTASRSSTTKKASSAARKTSSSARTRQTSTNGTANGSDAKRAAPAKKVPAMKVARTAAQQLAELTGREPECVIGIQRTEDGWQVELEVVESRRIPDSTDILAIYAVETDEDGDLLGYQRVRRYVRGKGGDGDGGRR